MTQHASRSTPPPPPSRVPVGPAHGRNRVRELPNGAGGERAAQGVLRESTWQEMGKDQPVGAALTSPEAFTPTPDDEATLDLQDQVAVPSPGLVEALDDCAASLRWSSPEWIRAGVFGEPPRPRDRPWRIVVERIAFYVLILALCGLFGWLVEVTVNAVAK